MNSKLYKKSLTLLLIMITISSIIEVRAFEWSEDFEDGLTDDWYFYGWDIINGVHVTQIDPGFSVVDGVLKTPKYGVQSFNQANLSRANHDTGVAYGSWSFDLLVSSEPENLFTIEFMVSDGQYNFNVTGISQSTVNYTGYALSIAHGQSENNPSIAFLKGSKTSAEISWSVLGSHDLTSDFTGTLHFEITRNTKGRFVVKLENDKIFDLTDNSITIGQRFGVSLWWGEMGIDNITVSDDPGGIPGYELELISLITVPIVIGLIYIISKRRKIQS